MTERSDDHEDVGERDEQPLDELRDRVVDDEEASTTSLPASTPDEASPDVDAVDDEHGGSSSMPGSGRDGPLGDLAADVEGRRQRKTPADDALFDEVDVGELDADELWAQVASDEPTVGTRREREVREIAKRKYCNSCPYFADPPDVGCGHEGTDIVEQVDMEHFKVADCPVVLEDERLEDVTTDEAPR
jgi:hypothetical protein